MLTPIIIAVSAFLAACVSAELELLWSGNRYGRPTERDSCFMCTVRGDSLQWKVNGQSYGGFQDSHMVRDVVTRDDSRGSQSGQNVKYMGILLDKTIENGEIYYTSLLIVYQPQLEEVVCRGLHERKEITEFNISLTNRNEERGKVKLTYIFSHEVRFASMPKYMYVLLCEVQNGESLSMDVSGNHVRRFNETNHLGTVRLELHGTNVISDAVLVSNRPSPENSLTAITLVFVPNMEEIFSVSCQAIESGESLGFNLPLHSSQTSTGMDHSTSDTTTGDVSSDVGSSSSTDSAADTSDSDSTTSSNENEGISSIIAPAVAVPGCVLIFVIPLGILIAWKVYKCRHRNIPVHGQIVESEQSIEAGRQDGKDYVNDVYGLRNMRPPEEERNGKFIEVVEPAGKDYLDSSNIAMIATEAAEHMYEEEADDEVDGVGANYYPAEEESGSDEVDGVDMHPLEEENESSPGLREMLGLRKRRK